MSLSKIQTELKAPKSQYNNFGKYNYRSLEDIMEALKPLLEEYKAHLIVEDDIQLIGERVYVKATATITFEGETSYSASAFARESLTKKGMDESQITGATSSYARKYALNGLFAIDDTKDADSMDNSKEKLPVNKDATAADKKAAMQAFADICKTLDVDPKEFLASQGVDTEKLDEKYKAARKWLNSVDLLHDQLLTYKHGTEEA